MIVVKVELWPEGDETTARETTRIAIANVGGKKTNSRYIAVIKEDDGTEIKKIVEGHMPGTGIQDLVERAIAAPPIHTQPPRTQAHFARQLKELAEHMGK